MKHLDRRDIPLILALSFLLALAARAQDTRPRLELEPRINFNGGGFQAVSASMTAGAGMENKHFVWHVSGTYDAAAKADYLDKSTNLYVHNPHGNIRSVGGNLFARTSSGWLFGTAGYYASLRTTDYSKSAWSVAAGIGHDWMHATCPTCKGETSLRLLVLYGPLNSFTKPDIEHGFTADVTIPSPIETKRHVFFGVRAFAGWIKTSATGSYGHDAGASLGIRLRF